MNAISKKIETYLKLLEEGFELPNDVTKEKDAEGLTKLHHIALRHIPEHELSPTNKYDQDSGYSLRQHQKEIMKAAMKHPEFSTIKDNDGNTPLHYAAHRTAMVLKHPHIGTVKNNKGQTPFEIAMDSENIHHSKTEKHPLADKFYKKDKI